MQKVSMIFNECFKKLPVPAGVLKKGRNEAAVEVEFKRTTNIEALYLVGDFGVRLDGTRRTVTAPPARMGCRNYADYAMPFYTGNLTFVLRPENYKETLAGLENAERILLTPVGFTGAAVKVEAAGKTAVLGWEPFEADVTEAVKNGETLRVTVLSTRANLFGPLHETPRPASACGPGSFVTEGENWTDGYTLLDSGLRGFTFRAQKRIGGPKNEG